MKAPSLADLPLFEGVDPEMLRLANRDVEWFALPAERALFQAGDKADALYLLVTGTLVVIRDGALSKPDVVGYIRPGEPVGEMALVMTQPHSISVFALRDSELIRLPVARFEQLMDTHPQLVRRLSQLMLSRLTGGTTRLKEREPRVFALISTSPSIDLVFRATELRAAILLLGRSCQILDEQCEDWTVQQLDAAERDNDVVLMIAGLGGDSWTRLAMGRADRVWLLARSDARPSTPILDEKKSPAAHLKLIDVVLLHFGGVQPATAPQAWIDSAEAARLFHWRQDRHQADVARLARTLCGCSIGLVLSGGGARAYAHIGVVRALREADVPIDFVGGVSMGAIVAAGVAMEWSDEDLVSRIRRAFVHSDPLNDWRLPVVSIARGGKVDRRLKDHFGELQIAEMCIPFFCVSSSLSKGESRLHRSGRLRDALRASIAIPGLLPPVVLGEEVLVDGAVCSNFPVDEMQAFHRGVTIGADVTQGMHMEIDDFIDPPGFVSWVRRHGFRELPPIASILMQAATFSSKAMGQQPSMLVRPPVEAEIRDWKRFEETVQTGYDAAKIALGEKSALLDQKASIPRRI